MKGNVVYREHFFISPGIDLFQVPCIYGYTIISHLQPSLLIASSGLTLPAFQAG